MADEVVSELEEYVNSVELEATIRPMIEALLRKKPLQPVDFMMEYLSDAKSSQARATGRSGVIMYVSHKDPEGVQLLQDCGMANIIKSLVEGVLSAGINTQKDAMVMMEETLLKMKLKMANEGNEEH